MENNSPHFYHDSLDYPQNKFINLLHLGWEKCKPGYSYSNYRNIYLVHYIKSGKGILQINNEKISLCANNVFLIRPNTLAVYTADTVDPWEYYYFAFNGDFADYLIERTAFHDGKFYITVENDNLVDYISDASDALQGPQDNDISAINILFKFLSCIAIGSSVENQVTEIQKQNIRQKYISAVQEYIKFNFSKPIVIADIARSLGLNRSYLYKIYKEETGKSIEEHLISVRINEARSLLHETSLSVTTISQLVGYTNYPSFFRTFKSFAGSSPREYRNKMKAMEKHDALK